MDVRRQPLKRLCPGTVNESPRKRRFPALDGEKENSGPPGSGPLDGSSRNSWSSLLRITEQEVKPDTPAIPSVRSRIQMLRDVSSTVSPDAGEDRHSVSWADSGKDVSVMEAVLDGALEDVTGLWDVNNDQTLQEPPVPSAHSTLAARCPLPSLEDLPSQETASRLRKERQEELAMVCTVLDHNNPWRVKSMRRPKRAAEQGSLGSESVELSLEGSDRSLDVSDERCVSSLEIQLRGSHHSDSVSPRCPEEGIRSEGHYRSPSHSPSRTTGVLLGCVEDDRVTLNSSELIDRLFEAALENGADSDESDPADASDGLDTGDTLDEPDAGDGLVVVTAESGSDELDMELPPVSILSPLTKSVDIQAAISPLHSVVSSLPELLEDQLVTPKMPSEEDSLHYSIDRYRTLRRNVLLEASTRPCTPTHHAERQPPAPSDVKERIKVLSKEVASLQRVMEQACCALSCCVDAEHGKGSRQEAEAERLLLVSTEKKAALLKELERLRGPGDPQSSAPGELAPCRGSVFISDIQLPLKVDYVCSTLRGSGAPGHYFLVLIRFGTHSVVATPLACSADAQTGDTILFPTTVTLKDTTSDFNIDIEVYSLAQGGSAPAAEKRKSLKPKITPKKLLSSRKSSLNSPACSPALSTLQRSSHFMLVGSLTLTLESLGKFKFPLEKMRLEGKVGRLLGNHFQDQVPFLSPLEGSLSLKLQCQSHSCVQSRGFLTMFEDVGGLGAWHRRWCVLSGNCLSFWSYPEQETSKEPVARINLINCTSAKIEAAPRESCARAHTLQLTTMRPQREDDTDTLVTQCRNTLCFTKHWLSADTREEKQRWMDCLNQVLLDLRTWRSSPGKTPAAP